MRLTGDRKFVNIALGVLTAAATIGILQALWIGMPSLFLPVVGATAGKVLTVSLIAVVTTGLVVSAPKAVAPLILPSPTPTNIPTATTSPARSTLPVSQPLSQRYLTSTAEEAPMKASTSTMVVTNTPALTETPSPTATPQDPLVLVYTACFKEPRINDKVVSHLDVGTRVKLVARSDDGMWWLVENPVYHSLCWVQKGDLQLDPGVRIEDVPIFYIFSNPTSESTSEPQCTSDTPYSVDRACYCKWHPGPSGPPYYTCP